MLVFNINSLSGKIQDNIENDFIFCPMCEESHENNSWCQFSGSAQ